MSLGSSLVPIHNVLAEAINPVGRKLRNPTHTFNIKHRPFLLQPFMVAPVLPGETLKNIKWQARAVTDPIVQPLIGWWLEYYFFYVKLRDLAARDAFTAMVLDPDYDMSSYKQATTVHNLFYTGVDGVKWVELAYERIVEEYFRDEGHANSPISGVNADSNGLCTTYMFHREQGWWDNLELDSAMEDADPNDTSELDAEVLRAKWDYLRKVGMTKMTFDDYLRTFGVTVGQELHKPELLRFVKEWQYPSNTVDPATGVPTSAVSWSVAERADKDRFFREPGFIIGLTAARPKLYMANQTGNVTAFLDNAMAWLPAIMNDMPETSLRMFANGTGPVPSGMAAAYWIDLRDLFLYGDQWNQASPTGHCPPLPTNNSGRFRAFFDSTGMPDDLFTSPGDDTTPAKRYVRQDGRVDLSILGAQIDHT